MTVIQVKIILAFSLAVCGKVFLEGLPDLLPTSFTSHDFLFISFHSILFISVFRREGRALYPDGEQLWEMEAFTVTMCVRNCMSDRRCEKLAFNSASRQCHGFSFVLNNLKANVNWQIWNRW